MLVFINFTGSLDHFEKKIDYAKEFLNVYPKCFHNMVKLKLKTTAALKSIQY